MAGKIRAVKTRFLLDTAGILEAPNLSPSDCVTCPEVTAEIRPGGASARRLEQMLAGGMEVRIPTNESIARVQERAQKVGNLARLSAADVAVLALALDVPGTLVSDDYTVLDLASRFALPVQTIRTTGVQRSLEWAARCKGCGRQFDAAAAGAPCRVCGSPVALRPTQTPDSP